MKNDSKDPVLQENLRLYRQEAWSILPVGNDKKPAIAAWKKFMNERAGDDELNSWFLSPKTRKPGIGIICGRLSRLMVLDVETDSAWRELQNVLDLDPDIKNLIVESAVARTPGKEAGSPGRHVYIRCDHAPSGGMVLARDLDGKVKVETRGEGHYVVAPGSSPKCHPSGRQYEWDRWLDHEHASSWSEQQVARLQLLCRQLDEKPADMEAGDGKSRSPYPRDDMEKSPGTDYCRRGRWEDLLDRHGWVATHERAGVTYWLRPGKTSGTSATTGHCRGEIGGSLLYVFSSNAQPFEAGKTYSLFGARALLDHGGDFAECATKLIAEGFGPQPGPCGVLVSKQDLADEDDIPRPSLSSVVFRGPIGEFVLEIAESTEADPAAILIHALAFFGHRVGRACWFRVGADHHYPNLFALLIGGTASGRKGMSSGIARALFSPAGSKSDRLTVSTASGLSSSEGLIREISETPVEGKHGRRVMVLEPEFSSVFQQSDRLGNTLSACLRQCWDGGNLQVMTRAEPLRASEAHVTVVGHITPADLQRHMQLTDVANGLANRFLFLTSRRSRCIPDPSVIGEDTVRPFRKRLLAALTSASSFGQVERDSEAQEQWRAIYAHLEPDGDSSIADQLGARAVAHVSRLSLVYALQDGSPIIKSEHLEAGIALWQYSNLCIKTLFKNRVGHAVASKVLEIVRINPGVTKTKIHRGLGNNINAAELDLAISHLLDGKMIERETSSSNGGRPRSTYRAVG